MRSVKILGNRKTHLEKSFFSVPGAKYFLYKNRFLACFLFAGIILGLLIRYRLLPFTSLDFWLDLNNWYDKIRNLGLSALRADFSNYSPLYIYVLFIIHGLFPSLPNLLAVKFPSIFMDLVCASLAFGLIFSATRSKLRAAFACLSVFLAPTMIFNSAYWGQADVFYTSFLVLGVWLLISRRFSLAMLSYGVALAFKLQSVFLGPFIAALFLIGFIPWKKIFLIPIPYVISIVPAWIAGRPLPQLLMIFWNQAGTYKRLTLNAASVYTWFSEDQYSLISKAGIFFAMGICLLFIAFIFFRKRRIGNGEIVLLATVSVFLVPFFLPSMHERYFYPADVFSILLVFCYPELFLVPVFSQLSSFFTYQPFFTDKYVFPLSVISFLNLAAIVFLTRKAVFLLYLQKPLMKKKPLLHV